MRVERALSSAHAYSHGDRLRLLAYDNERRAIHVI